MTYAGRYLLWDFDGTLEAEVRRQLRHWVLEQQPHEPRRRAQTWPEHCRVARLAEEYGVDGSRVEACLALQPSAADAILGRRD